MARIVHPKAQQIHAPTALMELGMTHFATVATA